MLTVCLLGAAGYAGVFLAYGKIAEAAIGAGIMLCYGALLMILRRVTGGSTRPPDLRRE